ncbi:MAG: hypothetical protein KDB27_11950 [Planctomycetales bacterium]|nr:hypothetical protein [Planctomycetales bacterium]
MVYLQAKRYATKATRFMDQASFSEIDAAFSAGGIESVLDALENRLRDERKFHELFECLKMRVRHSLNLPLLYSDAGDDLEADTQDALEQGLIDACRTVGTLLLDNGQIREGWTYLRPVGDRKLIHERLKTIQITEDNVDQVIEVCLHESVDLEKGFQLLLEHYGTCNSITTFESSMYGHPRIERCIGAKLLVEHVHAELLENILGHIEREENKRPDTKTIAELLDGRNWLTADGAYHIDVTHLSSVVRIGRDVTDSAALEKALDLTHYGQRLGDQLQYPGDAPFENHYKSHATYFRALLGQSVDEGLAYFREQAERCSPHEETTAAIEIYIDLLHRIGRTTEAIDAMTRLIPSGMQTTGQAPSLLSLCEAADNYDSIRAQCRENGDLLGYAMGVVKASSGKR